MPHYAGTLGAAEDDKALQDIYDEASAAEGKEAGEKAVQATITAGCVATTTQYGGALWCGPLVSKAWPVIKEGMQWITQGMGDVFFAIVPNAWKAKGAHCWMCDLQNAVASQLDVLWEDTVDGLEAAWHEARAEAGLAPQSIDINAELRKRLWADPIGPGLPSRTRSNPDTLTQVVTKQECYPNPGAPGGTVCRPVSRVLPRPDAKPWDRLSGSGFNWTSGQVRLLPSGGPAEVRADGLPKDPNDDQVAEANAWYLATMQSLRFRPFAFTAAEILRDMSEGIEIEKAEARKTSPVVTLGLLGAAGTAGYFAWKAGWFAKLWRMVT